jgi:phosphatidylserine decarboxylase
LPQDGGHSSYIVAEGLPFVAIPAVLTIVAFLAGYRGTGVALLLVTCFVLWFFRNPERTVPVNPLQLVSPADGKVIRIEEAVYGDHSGPARQKISIFMNVFNVHVNRMPLSGEVVSIHYKPGKFFSADLDKASEVNERNTVLIRTEEGREIIAVQIAGLIARRIVCWLKEGMKVRKGDRFGLIRFGSRVDVYLPLGSKLLVNIGDTVRAGETPIGELR